MARNPLGDLGNGLGDYLREQRVSARLSVRQLSELAGISNPYLSQIERGLKRPSAEILQQIAKGLSISAETLYVQAGLLDPEEDNPQQRPTAREAIAADLRLTSRQRQTLIDIYDSFVGAEEAQTDLPGPLDLEGPPSPQAETRSRPAKRTPAKAAKRPVRKSAKKIAAKATPKTAAGPRRAKKAVTRRAAPRVPQNQQSRSEGESS